MARIRFSTPGYMETSRRRTVYNPKAYDDLYVPYMVYPRHRIDTSGEENEIRRSVNDELLYTTHLVDDTYDLAAKSRNRDAEILRDANRAIVDTEFVHSPKAAVAARRAQSHPPVSTVTVSERATRLSSVPPRPIVVAPIPSYVRRPRQAALVGNKVDVVLPTGHRKRPKSRYAADVIREINLKKAHEAADQGQCVDVPAMETSHLHASARPVYYESQAKAHWDEFGDVAKPKNILSWKYRLQARIPPGDLLYMPKTYDSIHSQLRFVHDKMDRHRQLMDRYLGVEIKPHVEDVRTKIMSI